jgi:putative DNA primase/helicase
MSPPDPLIRSRDIKHYAVELSAMSLHRHCDHIWDGADPELKGTIVGADSRDAADGPVGSDALVAVAASIAPKSDVCLPAASRGWVSHGRFKMAEAGLFETVSRKQGPASEYISPPFWIVGHARDASGKGWGRVLRWIDPDGKEHQELVPDSGLSRDARSIAAGLADEGLVVGRVKVSSFAEYLQGCSVARRFTIVDRTAGTKLTGSLLLFFPIAPFAALIPTILS